jgi:hypothetical protein
LHHVENDIDRRGRVGGRRLREERTSEEEQSKTAEFQTTKHTNWRSEFSTEGNEGNEESISWVERLALKSLALD